MERDQTNSTQLIACEHGTTCGGCPLISYSYPEQLARKAQRVERAIRHFPLLAKVPISPVIGAESQVEYRARTKLVVGPNGVGLYASGGHTLVDLPGCRVLTPEVAAVVARIRSYLSDATLPVHDESTERLGLRGVDLRGSASGNSVLVTLIVDDEQTAKDQCMAMGQRLAREEPSVVGVFLAPHKGDSPRLLAAPLRKVAGRDRIEDQIGETLYVAGPGSFVQAHRGQAARVHEMVAEHAKGPGASSPRVLDLFGGGGGIGLFLARKGARVTSVETFLPAVEDARASAELNHVTVETIARDADQGLDILIERRARFELVILNPPRRGCEVTVREKVATLRPDRIAYVSCDPETLARDLDHFRRLGYSTLRAVPVDMIPLTEEIETVALLTRTPTPHPVILHEDQALLVVSKWPNEPVASHPERATCTLDRVRGRTAWAKAAVLFAPDEGSSGACALIASGTERARWAPSNPLRVTMIALVRGIVREQGTLRRGGDSAARYRRIAVIAGQSLVEIEIDGDGTQRARREMAEIEHPIIGDHRAGHPATNRHIAERYTLSRPFLHVSCLELDDPRTEGTVRIECPLAPDLTLVLQRMGADPATLFTQAATTEG